MRDSSSFIQRNSQLPLSSNSRLSNINGPGSSARRPSLAPMRAIAQKRQSMTVDSFNNANSRFIAPSVRHSIAPSSRRSSTFVGGRASNASFLSQGVDQGDTRDPRPVRDKAFQSLCATNIVNYLINSGYPSPITIKNILSPTTKEFQSIFKYLYNKIDPNFSFVRRIDEDVKLCLKDIQYPYAESITRSHLMAIGSPHSRPVILAMLHWMVEVVQCIESLSTSQEEVPPDDEHFADKAFFEYLVKSYHFFLDDVPDDSSLTEELCAFLDSQNSGIGKEIENLEKNIQSMTEELEKDEELAAVLSQLQQENAVLQEDELKLQAIIERSELRIEKLQSKMGPLGEELNERNVELERLNQEKLSLQAQIEAQPISTTDLDRMTSEREQLSNGLNQISNRIQELRREILEAEGSVQTKTDSLEKLVQRYNTVAYRLGIVPSTAPRANDQSLELGLLEESEGCLNLDLKNIVRPFLINLRHNLTTEFHSEQSRSLELQESLDKINENVTDTKEELDALEIKIENTLSEYTMLKAKLSEEKSILNSESDKLEHELQQLKLNSQNTLLQLDQRIQALRIEYDHTTQTLEIMKGNAYKEVAFMLDEIIHFKLHIQNGLEELETDYEKELAEASK
ncbi:spindle pole body protein Ndc80 [Schizosaccharomyces japonicus yFS275]|uniref:Kinetochore protein NDC80 n=1 Tax=Schizosaccharomyces japonicus (strain yFS275 / FY16936) TaxID=402676 RepID=B6K5V0_SCHJY|nr:spindle pole body protein Ndc80 [Schizosaccharomyces japonicus yFS275]EEB08904.1 spindle pole body protein Ndc80 [Schizosaccharomyces japonicus yFS275]